MLEKKVSEIFRAYKGVEFNWHYTGQPGIEDGYDRDAMFEDMGKIKQILENAQVTISVSKDMAQLIENSQTESSIRKYKKTEK